MLQMYTIFKNDCSILLTDNPKNKHKKNFYYWHEINFEDLLFKIENDKIHSLILYHFDIDRMWSDFLKEFEVIEAAGGVILNSSEDILFILRNGKWDLPKGKIEKNETISEAAMREVKEECGISNVNLGEFIATTYHIYYENDQRVLKISHWYKMICNSNRFKPQLEEGITQVVWKNKDEVNLAIQNSYPNIKLLIEKLD
jgi:ADP-ribose pyrophosphatase YjhB (NUDIX family)